jgi:betaine-aldehyde dehydrogenase
LAKGIKAAFRNALRNDDACENGASTGSDTNFGPMVSIRQRSIVEGSLRRRLREGATRWSPVVSVWNAMGFHRADRFADVTDDMTIARDEIFGPVMSGTGF